MTETRSARDWLEEAEGAHAAGDLKRASHAYQQALDAARREGSRAAAADARYGLGTLLLQLRQPAAALTELDAALRLSGDVPEYHFNRALALERLGQADLAVESYLTAVGTAGGSVDVLSAACEGLRRLGRNAEVEALLGPARSDPSQQQALKARALAAGGDWLGAIALCRELTADRPDDAAAWRLRASLAAQLRDHRDAMEAFERYLALVDPSAEDHLAHADLLLTVRRPDAAGMALTAARDLGAVGAETDHLEARYFRLAGEHERARALLVRVVQQRPHDGTAWEALAELTPTEHAAPLTERLEAVLAQSGGGDEDRIMIELTRGRLLARLARYDEAFAAFDRANARHRAMLEGRSEGYDTEREERENSRRLQRFPATASARTDPSDPTPLFIVGMPRSGTTLLERILAGLPGVEAGGENEALDLITAQYELALRREQAPAPSAMTAEQWHAFSRRYWALTPVAAGTRVFIDKMPHNTRHIGLIAHAFPSARILWMRRDPRDVALSIYSRLFSDAHRYACDLRWLGHQIAETDRLMTGWRTRYPDRIRAVDYRELVEKPREVMPAIAEFCGLTWTETSLAIERRPDAAFTFSELQVRRPINRDGIDRHRPYARHLAVLDEALAAHRRTHTA
jgi:tetratricopeptide (TPR) repeat protein